MKTKIIWLIIIFSFLTVLDMLVVFKPAKAMAPPPASHIWIWSWIKSQTPQTATAGVTVTWQEGTRTETVNLKTFLKNKK